MFWSAPLSADLMTAPRSVSIDDRKAPEDCATMVDVRQGVDALDRALVTLLAERQRYMDAAARIKPNRDAVFDQARIDDVVAKVLAAAEPAGSSGGWPGPDRMRRTAGPGEVRSVEARTS